VPALISCCVSSYGRYGAQVAIEQIRAAGVTHLELPIRDEGFITRLGDPPLLTHTATETDIAGIEQMLSQHDVRLSSCNILSGNPLNPRVVEVTFRKLEIAARLGVSIVIGESGQAGSPKELATLYQHLQQIGDQAARLGITYCCETHPGLCQEPQGMLTLMQDLAHPHIRINFDTGNLLYFNSHINGEIALQKVCTFVKSVHLKDTQGEFQKWYFPALGYGGAVDFTRTRQILKAVGFQGPFCIEIQGIEGEESLTLVQHQQRIVQSVKTLRLCGYWDC